MAHKYKLGVDIFLNNKIKTIVTYVAAIVLLLFLTSLMFTMNKEEEVKPKYYEILQLFENAEVENYLLDLGTGELKITKKPEEGKEKGETVEYLVPNVSVFLTDIDTINQQNGFSATEMQPDYLPIKETPWWISMLPTLLLIGAMAIFWFFMMRQQGAGKAMDFAKAKYKDKSGDKPTTFKDVAGCNEEKEELEEIVQFLKHPNQFNALGARIPKGVLLMGQPGTGKTLLARAVAGEAGVPFFSISGSDFVEMFVGVGASRVRDLFGEAKKNAPAIIFIDEIDAVGRHRGAGLGGGHDGREQTLNQLLVEMDGFGNNTGIIVMAATNRADILDPALLRPGRFDRQIVVGAPDVEGREAILKIHTRNKPLGPDVDLGVIAKSTAGFTGAELENLTNEAALLAARRKKKAITMKEIEEATIKVVAGPEKRSRKVNEKDKRLTSYHEAGHAVVTYFCETQDPVHEISIVPRGYAGGYTMSLPVEDRNYVTKGYMEEELCTLLGGRVAEAIVLGDISTGASNDLERATKIARNMVTRYGFSEKLGPVVYGSSENEVFLGRDYGQSKHYSDDIASDIDSEIRRLVDEAYEKTESILREHRDKLDAVAAVLMEKEKVSGKEFADIMNPPAPVIEEPVVEDTTPETEVSDEKTEE